MKNNKEDVIRSLISLLENEDVEIIQIGVENESEFIANYKGKHAIEVNTGHSDLRIKIFNRKQHAKFISKLHS